MPVKKPAEHERPLVRVRKRKGRGLELVWTDPFTGQRHTKTAPPTMRQAEREAAQVEGELRGGQTVGAVPWTEFLTAARRQWLSCQSGAYRALVETAVASFEKHVGAPRDTKQITSQKLAEWHRKLSAAGRSPETIRSYTRHICSLLNKGGGAAGIPISAPKYAVPNGHRCSHMRNKPASQSDYEAMLEAADRVRNGDAAAWRRLISVQFLGGLRLSEGLCLSWDKPPIQIDLTGGRRPRLLFYAEGQKARRDEYCPMSPEFHDWLQTLPPGQQTGRVCGVTCQMQHASAKIREIAREAGVNVTAHDLRRSFGTRWAMKVKPAVLMRMMRHRNIETTMRYYVDIDSDDIADQIWGTS